MASVASYHGDYDPDDLDLAIPRRTVVATATMAADVTAIAPRIRESAISELKAFMGRTTTKTEQEPESAK
ncbi:hypothetical protein PC121_g10312 [Phytophthora cactorum]|nr:hypothetical protein PC121_g10312 [Phytophthora cactorum]